ncbi:MAG: YraN family protein, partial [Muribaculaceae bacterium]|nr:YraN family protein [Muribaculaceae bacterium]
AEYLGANGDAIADRNWRCGQYGMEIVAYKGSRIIFVEVKTRSDNDEDPLEAVDKDKTSRLIRAAVVYINTYEIDHEIQFDLIAINGTSSDYTIEHIPDAFIPPLKTY